MKKSSVFLLILSASWLLTSCGGLLGRAIDPDRGGSGNFTATVDGKSWKADQVSAISLFGYFTMTANKGENEYFSVSFLPDQINIGKSYSFDGEESGKFAVTFINDQGTFVPATGTIRITSFRDNRTLEGEMEFESLDLTGKPIQVKNAKFKASIVL